MCGIAGILNVDGKPVSINTLKKMTDAIKHRGPDGEGFWTESFVGFGHRRLAIIDLSPLGHQPMQNNDGSLVIAYNGEVYNFQNIRLELEAKGYAFHSRTDTEVVLKSYQEWGKACVGKFNGMFAFAIWDKKQQQLFIARDRYGIKPLYYYYKNGVFLFGSEIKALLTHPDFSVSVSIQALNEYFSFQNVFSDLTLFEGVRLLPAAHTLTLRLGDLNSLRTERYWDYHFRDELTLTEDECALELSRLFEQAVNRQLISDVEVGSYLSGGMDSGSVTAIAARSFRNLKTFTGGFDLSSASGLELGFDERTKAEFLSNAYKTEHYEVVLKAGDMERVMPDLVWHLEDLRLGQSYPNYYIARLASKFVKVVLSGAGGDELFAGYPWRYFSAVSNDDPNHYIDKYYRYWQRLVSDSEKPDFYQPSIYPQIWDYQTKDVFRTIINGKAPKSNEASEYVNQSLYFEMRTFLHGLFVVEDKLSMAHSLESRVPFMDNDLVDFAMRVPARYKLMSLHLQRRINENDPQVAKSMEQTTEGKQILRKALSPFMPEQFTNGAKQGFSAPDASWFRGESIEYIRTLLFDRKARIYDYIQPAKAQAFMREHFDGKTNRRLLIWSLLSFEWWLRQFIK
ncbi:MAG: asparagine synthase (glutamine-hydrolyzing) [Bacteroidetes bacterium]|nr:asparagine synthase (glutamine-hydrolyzing) [Bacteroidota bacterium]MCW5897439.1 asparagine synthase (glutamine-hydrolyzing) [Bacteroidota bacterium]